jgi:hypothetical protein
MIYAIVGTDKQKREKAQERISLLGIPSSHIYSEHIATLVPLIDATNLFGDTIIALLIQTMDTVSSKEVIVQHLEDMQNSKTVFVIDEPFADVYTVKKLEKYAKTLYDCRKEKEAGVTPFTLCNAFAKRDKKVVWIEWMKIRDKDSAEAIHGALWWKMRSIWEDVLSGKPSKFSKSECESFAHTLVRMNMEAHRGKVVLRDEIEKILLTV